MLTMDATLYVASVRSMLGQSVLWPDASVKVLGGCRTDGLSSMKQDELEAICRAARDPRGWLRPWAHF